MAAVLICGKKRRTEAGNTERRAPGKTQPWTRATIPQAMPVRHRTGTRLNRCHTPMSITIDWNRFASSNVKGGFHYFASDNTLLRVLTPSTSASGALKLAPALNRNHFGLRLSRQQLAQHILENASVSVVQRFLRSVDAHDRLKLGRLRTLSPNGNFSAGRKFLHRLANSRNLKYLFASQLQCLGIFPL